MRTELTVPNRFYANSVGFDRLFEDFFGTDSPKGRTFPPYNLLKKDNVYTLELALAGYSKDQVDITLETDNYGRRLLVISSKGADELEEGVEYLERGLAARAFSRHWIIDQHVEVTDAEFINGVLRVQMEKKIPEELKPRSIEIK